MEQEKDSRKEAKNRCKSSKAIVHWPEREGGENVSVVQSLEEVRAMDKTYTEDEHLSQPATTQHGVLSKQIGHG